MTEAYTQVDQQACIIAVVCAPGASFERVLLPSCILQQRIVESQGETAVALDRQQTRPTHSSEPDHGLQLALCCFPHIPIDCRFSGPLHTDLAAHTLQRIIYLAFRQLVLHLAAGPVPQYGSRCCASSGPMRSSAVRRNNKPILGWLTSLPGQLPSVGSLLLRAV